MAANLVRKLSFGRKRAPANPPVAVVSPPPEPSPPAPVVCNPVAPEPPQAELKKVGTRRTLSFNRKGRGQGAKPASKEPGQKSSPSSFTTSPAARSPAARMLPGSFARALNLQQEAPSDTKAVSLNHLKRTNSWSRGHRQANKAETAAKAAAVKALLAAAPSLLAELPPHRRKQLSQAHLPPASDLCTPAHSHSQPPPTTPNHHQPHHQPQHHHSDLPITRERHTAPPTGPGPTPAPLVALARV